jgi:Protein tyrosine and serine/threonine kinase
MAPLEKLDLESIKRIIVEQKSRPAIPKDLNSKLSELIRMCWQEKIENRPKFGQINDILMRFNLESNFYRDGE